MVKPKSQPKVLAVICGLFVLAIMTRISTFSAPVWAQSSVPAAASTCPPSEVPLTLIAALNDREAAAVQKEAELATQAEEIRAAEADLARQHEEIARASEELNAKMQIYDAGAEPEVAQLTSVYEAMKPEDASRLFSEMDPEFAAGFLARMSPSAAAGVLAGLDPAVAYAMSVELAGRNVRSGASQ